MNKENFSNAVNGIQDELKRLPKSIQSPTRMQNSIPLIYVMGTLTAIVIVLIIVLTVWTRI